MEEMNVPSVQFVGQQDGPVEGEFLTRLAGALDRSDFRPSYAYLCRVRYSDNPEVHVALCLMAPSEHEAALVGTIGSTFRSMFNSNTHLDTFFFAPEQHAEIRAVCNPFYFVDTAV